MKKKLLTLLGIIFILTSVTIVDAKPNSSAVTNAIKLYKAGNYSECYVKLIDVVKKDPSNALAYYYLAIASTRVGKKAEAIENYEKAISLSPANSNINLYSQRGKACLENSESCKEVDSSSVEQLIRTKSSTFSEKVRSDYERLKLENIMRQMNKSPDVAPQDINDFRDYSSSNATDVPTNEEIVAAMKTLQRAGFGNMIMPNNMSLLMNENNNYGAGYYGGTSFTPQMMQAMFTNNMSLGF